MDPLFTSTGDPQLLTTREVAHLLRVTPRTVRRYGDAGRIERVRLSERAIRYTAGSVAVLVHPDNETRPPGGASASMKADGAGRQRER